MERELDEYKYINCDTCDHTDIGMCNACGYNFGNFTAEELQEIVDHARANPLVSLDTILATIHEDHNHS